MKKRLTSLLLAGLLLMCGPILSPKVSEEKIEVSESITVASSDAEIRAEWLTDRLGEIPDRIVMGIGDSDKYGVDMSAFEKDGYIIRTLGDSTLIFGKTDDGLDRGVRKYAIAVERGENVSNITYHEGYRIDNFRIFGVDISEYVIEYGTEPNENMRFAAAELIQLVKKACGAELTVSEIVTDSLHKIILRHSNDEELKTDGYRYFAEGTNLVIEGAVERGCMYGVYRFLENECGWRHLIFGTSILEDAEFIDIPSEISVTETPAFDYIDDSANPQKYPYINDRTPIGFNSAKNSFGSMAQACHGMYTWSPETGDVNCYTNQEFYEVTYERTYFHLWDAVENGSEIGKQIKDIDISQKDCRIFCMCEDCYEFYTKDKSYIGPIVHFANTLAEDLNADFPGIIVKIFGYFQSVRPPEITKMSDNVSLTYAPNGNCARHALNDGESCTSEVFQGWNNVEYGGYLEQWCEMSDKIYVWYYSWGLFPKAYTMVDVFYEDLKWFAELGVKGIYINRMDVLMDTTFLTDYMLRELNWNYDMTAEEFEEYLAVLMKDIYGDGWAYVREADRLLRQSQIRAVDCIDIWMYDNIVPKENMYNPFFYDSVFDYIVELMEKAIELAATEKELYACGAFAAGLYYMGATGGYFSAYDRGDTERIQWLCSIYDRMHEIGKMIGGLNRVLDGHLDISHIYSDLETLMWTDFVPYRDAYTALGTVQRPAPEK